MILTLLRILSTFWRARDDSYRYFVRANVLVIKMTNKPAPKNQLLALKFRPSTEKFSRVRFNPDIKFDRECGKLQPPCTVNRRAAVTLKKCISRSLLVRTRRARRVVGNTSTVGTQLTHQSSTTMRNTLFTRTVWPRRSIWILISSVKLSSATRPRCVN